MSEIIKHKFSVLVCVYDNDNNNYFIEAYLSILNQTLLPNQIVLVRDGPVPDNLKKSIDNFRKIAIRKSIVFDEVRLKTNMGHGLARNQGVINCKHELIALVDADDINIYNRFEKQVEVFNNLNQISVVGSQIIEIDHETKTPLSKKKIPCENTEIKVYLKTRCPFNQMTVMFKKSDIESVGGYKDFYHNEDYYLWIRMYLANYKFYNLNEYLVLARVDKTFYHRRGGVNYFLSEYKIQKIMFQNNIISLYRYIVNVFIRLTIQIVIPSSVRAILFYKYARKGV